MPGVEGVDIQLEIMIVLNGNLESENLLPLAEAGDLNGFQQERLKYRDLDVRAGSNVYQNRTPLHIAAQHGRLNIVECILLALRDSSDMIKVRVVNAKDKFGYTPLHLAVRSQHEDVVRMLTATSWIYPDRFLAATSDVNLNGNEDEVNQDCDGFTPLHLAAEKGNLGIAKLLLRRSLCSGGPYSAFDPVNILATNATGESALDIAKRKKHWKLVDFLESSDSNLMLSERAKAANAMNAVLVGATLVVAASFATWLQPPLGIPTDTNPDPISNMTFKQRSDYLILFFIFATLAFMLSAVALSFGIYALTPMKAASLKSELQSLQWAVHKATIILQLAIICLILAFAEAAYIVLPRVSTSDSKWSTTLREKRTLACRASVNEESVGGTKMAHATLDALFRECTTFIFLALAQLIILYSANYLATFRVGTRVVFTSSKSVEIRRGGSHGSSQKKSN